jgi:CO/xanthine dehydrogenase Mo-binding subunit
LKYAGDLPALQRMHHVKVLRSPFAHARIARIDVSRPRPCRASAPS